MLQIVLIGLVLFSELACFIDGNIYDPVGIIPEISGIEIKRNGENRICLIIRTLNVYHIRAVHRNIIEIPVKAPDVRRVIRNVHGLFDILLRHRYLPVIILCHKRQRHHIHIRVRVFLLFSVYLIKALPFPRTDRKKKDLSSVYYESVSGV